MPVVTEARQYDPFAVLTTVFAWQFLRVVDVPTRAARQCSGCSPRSGRSHTSASRSSPRARSSCSPRARSRRAPGAAHRAVGGRRGAVASVALNPRFLESTPRRREHLGEPLFSDVGKRLATTGRTLQSSSCRVGSCPTRCAYVLAAALVAGAVALALTWRRERIVLVMLGCVLGGMALMYIVGMSHTFAMSSKHLAPVWPLLAFVPVLADLRLPLRARQGRGGRSGRSRLSRRRSSRASRRSPTATNRPSPPRCAAPTRSSSTPSAVASCP